MKLSGAQIVAQVTALCAALYGLFMTYSGQVDTVYQEMVVELLQIKWMLIAIFIELGGLVIHLSLREGNK